MTVADLIGALTGLPDDMPVVMSKDAEGNGFSPLNEVETAARYQATSTWSGECVHRADHDEYPDAVPVICLWPVN